MRGAHDGVSDATPVAAHQAPKPHPARPPATADQLIRAMIEFDMMAAPAG